MKASFEVPAVVGCMDYHDIEDIREIFWALQIDDIKVEEKSTTDGGYYALIYRKGYKPDIHKVRKMINKYDDRE